jgi:hypothetical protein
MKKQLLAHVPPVVTAGIEETAQCLQGQEGEVIKAAIWAFCRQDKTITQRIVADIWFSGLLELEAPQANQRHRTFTEKVHALATSCYSALGRWFTRLGAGCPQGTKEPVLPDARTRGRSVLVRDLPS